MITRAIIALSFVFCLSVGYSQNFDKIGSKDAIKVSGGIGLNTIAYASQGIATPSREPFTWFANGNLTLSILDVSLPFTFSYSNQGGKFTQPFNRTAFHPSYKWVKGHIGMITMNFSPYTLSGHLFLGGGLELTPGKWKIQTMAGRLIKPVEFNPVDNNLTEYAYSRFGYGLRVEYNHRIISFSGTAFKGKDNPNSLAITPISGPINPQDNLVLEIRSRANITKKITIGAVYAVSGLTSNIENTNEASNSGLAFLNNAISGNSTTSFYNALNSDLTFKTKSFSIALKFEQIDPGYKTLGGYYFNNDLRNITVAPSFSLLKNRINVNLNSGFQQNNLKDVNNSTTNRWVGSANILALPMKGLVLSANYSNFSTFTQNRPNTDPFYYAPADTLNFYQLNQTAGGMISYSFGRSNIQNAVQAIYNYNESLNLTGAIDNVNPFGISTNETMTEPSKIHISNLVYTLQHKETGLGISIAGNLNYTLVFSQTTIFAGPSINLTKPFLKKKLKMTLGSTYNIQYTNEIQTSNIFNHRLSLTYNPGNEKSKLGKFSLSLNGNLLQRLPTVSLTAQITELNVFLNLGYNF